MMTSLAWLIYFANVSGTLKSIADVVSFFAGVSSVVGYVFLTIAKFAEDLEQEPLKIFNPLLKFGFATAAIALVLMVFLPSKNTIMMMAAASYGEDLYKSEVKDIVDPAKKLLKQWIEDQLKGAK
jgi:uncharacterized membrane protein